MLQDAEVFGVSARDGSPEIPPAIHLRLRQERGRELPRPGSSLLEEQGRWLIVDAKIVSQREESQLGVQEELFEL